MAKQELKQSTKPRLASDENNHKHIFFRNNKMVLSNQYQKHTTQRIKLQAECETVRQLRRQAFEFFVTGVQPAPVRDRLRLSRLGGGLKFRAAPGQPAIRRIPSPSW